MLYAAHSQADRKKLLGSRSRVAVQMSSSELYSLGFRHRCRTAVAEPIGRYECNVFGPPAVEQMGDLIDIALAADEMPKSIDELSKSDA